MPLGIDTFNLPNIGRGDYELFTANDNVGLTTWTPWRKPKGITFLWVIGVGGGGGGGSGFSGIAGTSRGGGGGGSAGAMITGFFSAFNLPDVLYMSIGTGGAPTVAGIQTVLSIYPSSALNFALGAAPGGNPGGTSGGSTGGTAGSAPSTTLTGMLGALGIFVAPRTSGTAGTGAPGGSNASAVNYTTAILNSVFLPGTGGGGVTTTGNSSGGGYLSTFTSLWPTMPASPLGGNGQAGYNNWQGQFAFTGGLGGGGNMTGPGGNGGKGAIGSGGGGGGGGNPGGSGGGGGDGAVWMIYG